MLKLTVVSLFAAVLAISNLAHAEKYSLVAPRAVLDYSYNFSQQSDSLGVAIFAIGFDQQNRLGKHFLSAPAFVKALAASGYSLYIVGADDHFIIETQTIISSQPTT